MKKILLIGTGVALLAGGAAFAQMPPGGMDRMGPDDQGMRGPEMMRHREFEMAQRFRRHDEAAAFRFKRGDMEIGIRCSEREPTQVCVNAVSTLLDKLNAAPASQTPPKTP